MVEERSKQDEFEFRMKELEASVNGHLQSQLRGSTV